MFREFAGLPPATPAEAAAFALRYAAAIDAGADGRHRLGRIKQLVRYYRAGGLFDGRDADRVALLRAQDAATIRAFFESFLGAPAAAG